MLGSSAILLRSIRRRSPSDDVCRSLSSILKWYRTDSSDTDEITTETAEGIETISPSENVVQDDEEVE